MIHRLTTTLKRADSIRPFSFLIARLRLAIAALLAVLIHTYSVAEEPLPFRRTVHFGLSYASVPGNNPSLFGAAELRFGFPAGKVLRVGPAGLIALRDRPEAAQEFSAGAGVFCRIGKEQKYAEATGVWLRSFDETRREGLALRCSFGTTRPIGRKYRFEPQVFIQFETGLGANGTSQTVRPGLLLSIGQDIKPGEKQ